MFTDKPGIQIRTAGESYALRTMFTSELDDQARCPSHGAAAANAEDVSQSKPRARPPTLTQAEQGVQYGGRAVVTAVSTSDVVHVHHVARRTLQSGSVVLAHVTLLDCRGVCNRQRAALLSCEVAKRSVVRLRLAPPGIKLCCRMRTLTN